MLTSVFNLPASSTTNKQLFLPLYFSSYYLQLLHIFIFSITPLHRLPHEVLIPLRLTRTFDTSLHLTSPSCVVAATTTRAVPNLPHSQPLPSPVMSVKFQEKLPDDAALSVRHETKELAHLIGDRFTGGRTQTGYMAVRTTQQRTRQ